MKLSIRTKRILKWTSGILGGILLLLLIAGVYINARWKPLLTEKIKAGVYNGSAHLYKIDFTDVHLNLFMGNITLDSIRITPDSMVYDSLKKARLAPTHVFELKLTKLQFSRVSLLTAYFKKHVKINTILLESPSINMMYSKVPARKDTVQPEKTLYQQISKTLRSIHVKNIRIKDADFDYYNRAQSAKPINAVKKLNVLVKDVLIDSLADQDTTRMLYAKDITYNITGYSATTKDKMYKMRVDSISGSATGGNLRIVGLKLTPLLADLEFSRKYSTQMDRYDLSFSGISATGINFRKLVNDGKLHIRQLEIGPAKVGVFMNRQLPPPNFNKGRNFPHLALKRAPVETIIDTLSLKGLDVSYTEFSEQTLKRGTIKLDNLSGTILNVTNDSLQLTRRSHAYADLYTRVMDAGKLNMKIDFHLNDPSGRFEYKGNVGPMDLKILNPLATNLGLVAIESGKVRRIDFAATGNWNGASGTLTMLYDDLKIQLLKKEDGKIKEKGFLSFLANNVLVINSNPRKAGDPVRTGKIEFSRPMTSSFFNLLWKSMFTGIRETVGIGIVPMKTPPSPKKVKK